MVWKPIKSFAEFKTQRTLSFLVKKSAFAHFAQSFAQGLCKLKNYFLYKNPTLEFIATIIKETQSTITVIRETYFIIKHLKIMAKNEIAETTNTEIRSIWIFFLFKKTA